MSFSRDLPDPGIEPESPALQADIFTWSTREAHIGALCRSDIVKNLKPLWMKYFYLFSGSSRNADDTFSVFIKH